MYAIYAVSMGFFQYSTQNHQISLTNCILEQIAKYSTCQ